MHAHKYGVVVLLNCCGVKFLQAVRAKVTFEAYSGSTKQQTMDDKQIKYIPKTILD